MGQTLKVVAGSDGGPWESTLLNEGVVVSYPDDATFEATVSRGGEEASLFTPTVAWISAVGGRWSISTAASDTAALDPGLYPMQVFVLFGGDRRNIFDGFLEVQQTVGNVAPPVVWCSSEDTLLYSDQIRDLFARKGVDATGFLLQRAQATDKRKRQIVTRYEPQGGMCKVRHNEPHPILGILDYADPTAKPPSKADLTDALDGGGIVLEEKIREIIARDAIALILHRQATGGGREYVNEAEYQKGVADDLFRCYQAIVDLSSTDYPQKATYPMALFDRDAILLPEGTAP